MCLVGLAWQSHPHYSLIIAANRDEFHARPTAAASWWADSPDIYGGRDLEAGGTWLAIGRDGRFGAVTNLIGSADSKGDFRSRGDLIQDYLRHSTSPAAFMRNLQSTHSAYRPFRLALGNAHELVVATSAGIDEFAADERRPACFALTNSSVGDSWPKAEWLSESLHQLSEENTVSHSQLLELLSTQRISDADENDTLDEVSASRMPFIRHAIYGTRASTVVTIDKAGTVRVTERSFASDGVAAGQSQATFTASPSRVL